MVVRQVSVSHGVSICPSPKKIRSSVSLSARLQSFYRCMYNATDKLSNISSRAQFLVVQRTVFLIISFSVCPL